MSMRVTVTLRLEATCEHEGNSNAEAGSYL